jgi:hypothetical protein
MTIRRITISVPIEMARRIKKAAGRTPVSAWIAGVIDEHLDDAELDRLWQEFYSSVEPRRGDVKRANAIFERLTKPAGRKRAA